MELVGFENYHDLKDAHYKWVDSAMQTDSRGKENKLFISYARKDLKFCKKIEQALSENEISVWRDQHSI